MAHILDQRFEVIIPALAEELSLKLEFQLTFPDCMSICVTEKFYADDGREVTLHFSLNIDLSRAKWSQVKAQIRRQILESRNTIYGQMGIKYDHKMDSKPLKTEKPKEIKKQKQPKAK